MKYRKDLKNGQDLSILGYGCLRFTKKGNGIDQEKAEEEMKYAIDQGVNYFDTAYTYKYSEETLGKFLAKGYREKVYIATKLPHYYCNAYEDFDKYFEEQLVRLQTDYIDYYLMHMLTDFTSWDRLCKMGIEKWIQEKQESGKIRQIGFSYHGGKKGFIEILESYNWDFCQIQYNYIDEHTQAGVEGLKKAHEKGIPVIIMEPLRGGKLAQVPKSADKYFIHNEKKKSPAQWALQWLWNQPEVTVVLSGMNDRQQVLENIEAAKESEPGFLTQDDLNMIEKVKEEINKKMKVPCTSCGYCMPCPHGVDIPVCFHCYNSKYSDGWKKAFLEYIMCTTLKIEPSNASKCVSCGLCEKHCPQEIPIRAKLKEVKKSMETPFYKIVTYFMRKRWKV